jgi:hypothetical protein
LVGLLWSVLGLVILLSVVDLVRGPDSVLRAWWGDLHASRGENVGATVRGIRRNPEGLRGR